MVVSERRTQGKAHPKSVANEMERQVYSLLAGARLYFRPFRGFCDLIGKVAGKWILIEEKVVENGENKIQYTPFNARMTLDMAEGLKAEIYLILKLGDGYYYMRGERIMEYMAKSKANTSSMRLGKWEKSLRPLEELIRELVRRREEARARWERKERKGGE